MHICFRVDASKEIGTVHLMRCFTLAEALIERGARVTFLCRHFPEEFQDRFQTMKMDCVLLNLKGEFKPGEATDPYTEQLGVPPEVDAIDVASVLPDLVPPVDWLVVDHYALDAKWERLVRPFCKQIMVIDDLHNRSHDCELLLDQNLHGEGNNPYITLAPEGCLTLLGPAYALLRPQFLEARQKLPSRAGSLKRILIFFTGTTSCNKMVEAIKAVKALNLDIALDIVPGVFYPYREELNALCSDMKSSIIQNEPDMVKLMLEADLSIGSPGSTTWESMTLGLPSVVAVSTENQLDVAKEAHKRGALINLGDAGKITAKDWEKTLKKLFLDPAMLDEMSESAKKLVDGQGTRRISEILMLTRSASP